MFFEAEASLDQLKFLGRPGHRARYLGLAAGVSGEGNADVNGVCDGRRTTRGRELELQRGASQNPLTRDLESDDETSRSQCRRPRNIGRGLTTRGRHQRL
jgi:hypothetical protein